VKKNLIVVSSIVGMVACMLIVVASTVSAKTIDLKFATGFSPKHTMQTKVFEPWAEKINKLSNGKVKVTFFPGGALGKTPDHYDLAEKGITDISYTLHDYTPGRFPMTPFSNCRSSSNRPRVRPKPCGRSMRNFQSSKKSIAK
jgi:TRAP-type C4-dicarboxylate transport system substrate-binding protein